MVGRDAELAALRHAWHQPGRLVVVSGGAGIGKSRLSREFGTWVRARGGVALTGRCAPAAVDVPLRPLREALLVAARAGQRPGPELDPYVPALGTLVPDWSAGIAAVNPNPIVLAEGVLRFLSGLGEPDAPAVLVIEDLQWADRETLTVLDYLADTVTAVPVMALATLRTGEPGAGTDLVTDLLARRAADQIVLGPLDDDQVATMIATCLEGACVTRDLSAAVTARSDGVPFFVEELLATVVGVDGSQSRAVPGSIAAALEPRLAALVPEALELVRHAAVLGRQFDWRLAAAASGCDEAAAPERLREAVRAQVLEMEGAGFRFRHALTLDAVADGLVLGERGQIAARLLTSLEQRDPELTGEHCQLAATLAEQAGDQDRAAELWVEAAVRASADGSLATAEALALRARPRRPRESDLALLTVLSLAGQPSRATEVGHRMLGELSDPLAASDVRLAMARAAIVAGRFDEGDRHLADAATAAGGDDARMARIMAAAAQVAMGRHDVGAALPLAERALAAAEATRQPDVECEALEAIGRAERGRDLEDAARAFARAHAVASEHGLVVWRIRALQELGTIDMFQTLATGRLEQARGEALEAGAFAIAAVVDLQLAAVHNERGEAEAALAAARGGEDTSRRFGLSTLPMSLAQQAMAHARSGNRAAMERAAAAARATGHDAQNVEVSLWGNAIALFHLGRRELPAAAAALDRSMMELRRLPGGAYPFPGLWALLRTVIGEGGDQARAEVRALPFDTPISRSLLAGADAVAAGRAGDRSEAEALFATADSALGRYERRFRQSTMRVLVAPCAARDGWGEPARWLRESLVTLDALGLVPMVAACRAALRQIGEPIPRAAPSGAAQRATLAPALAAVGLTARELEVLEHVAVGQSNREIAAALFVSVRTVEKHVERILMKTRVTRTGLAALAREAGMYPPDSALRT